MAGNAQPARPAIAIHAGKADREAGAVRNSLTLIVTFDSSEKNFDRPVLQCPNRAAQEQALRAGDGFRRDAGFNQPQRSPILARSVGKKQRAIAILGNIEFKIHSYIRTTARRAAASETKAATRYAVDDDFRVGNAVRKSQPRTEQREDKQQAQARDLHFDFPIF